MKQKLLLILLMLVAATANITAQNMQETKMPVSQAPFITFEEYDYGVVITVSADDGDLMGEIRINDQLVTPIAGYSVFCYTVERVYDIDQVIEVSAYAQSPDCDPSSVVSETFYLAAIVKPESMAPDITYVIDDYEVYITIAYEGMLHLMINGEEIVPEGDGYSYATYVIARGEEDMYFNIEAWAQCDETYLPSSVVSLVVYVPALPPLEITSTPTITCEQLYDHACCVNIENSADDPYAVIYYRIAQIVDDEYWYMFDWMDYFEPFLLDIPNSYYIEAYAQTEGKEASEITALVVVYNNPTIVTGAFIYANGIDQEKGLKVNICEDPSYGYDFLLGDCVCDGYMYQINHSGEWLQYDINASTIYLPEYGDYEITAYGYATGHGYSAEATAWIHYDAEGYTSYSQPRDSYYRYLVHDGLVYYFLNGLELEVARRDYFSGPCFWLSYHGDVVIPSTIDWNGDTYTVTRIGLNAFNESIYNDDTTKITSVTIPNTITYIDEGAFMSCSSLTNIDIPESVIYIGRNAFNDCIGLNRVICRALTAPAASQGIFYSYIPDIYDQATLFVPAEGLEAYQAHEEWGRFIRIVPFIGAGPGDTNGDGAINIADVTSLIDQLLGGGELPAYIDVNGDGVVNITDVTTLIDQLLDLNL